MSTDSLVEVDRRGRVTVLRMVDAANRNVLSQALISRLTCEFAAVERDPHTHVVVLAGLPEVFSLGLSRDNLLAFGQGVDLTTVELAVSAAMRCALPVVAAMRGHAMSGGLLLGVYADMAVLSDRSCYGTNFLRYGISPNAGATFLLGARLGEFVANEMLFTTRNYQGAELRRRGVPAQVAPHEEVEDRAVALAEETAAAPRRSLVLLKRHRTARLRAAVLEACTHEVTTLELLMSLPETRRRIEADYPTWTVEPGG